MVAVSGTKTTTQQAVQRRTLGFLAAAQLLSGIGNGATLSIGSLLAVDLSGSPAWAGAVTTVLTLAAAVAALPLAGLAVNKGRRAGLVTGLAGAMLGAVFMIVAATAGSFPLLLLGAAFLGLGSAANLQSRFAAVDLAAPESRGRSLAVVVWAITVGAVAGPNLITPGAAVGHWLGLPGIAGPFVFSAAGMLLAALLLTFGLRPDPLLLARRLAGGEAGHGDAELAEGGPGEAATTVAAPLAPAKRSRQGLRAGLAAIRASREATLALAAVVAAHGVMVAVMSMTPLQLQNLAMGSNAAGSASGHVHGDDMGALVVIGFTISLHIAGMFALSPLMGWLTDRAGRRQTIVLGFVLQLAAVAVAGLGHGQAPLIAAGLVMLGLGWSAATIAGSTLLAESVNQDSRVLAQGVSDTLMGAAGAAGGAFSGVVMSWAGYDGLNFAAAAVAAALLAWSVMAAGTRRRVEA